MPSATTPSQTKRTHRKVIQIAAILGGLFLLVVVVFGILFGAGYFIAGS